MSTKFHLSNDGLPRPCSANIGACPLGADAPHFASPNEARAYYENQQKGNVLNSSLKKIQPVPPDQERELVHMKIRAGFAQIGDQYDGMKIKDIKDGTKNTTWALVDPETGMEKKKVFKLDDQVEVVRNSFTKNAVKLQKISYNQKWMDRERANAKTEMQKNQASLNENIEKLGYPDFWAIDGLIKATAQEKIWQEVERKEKTGMSRYEAVEALAKEIQDDDFLVDRLSNSSSGANNLMEEEYMKAKWKFQKLFKEYWRISEED